MEISELIFNTIDKLPEAVLLLQADESGEWTQSYANQLMQKILDEGEMKSLLQRYQEEESGASFSLQNIEIFQAVYNVHFIKNNTELLIFFTETKLEDFFDSIKFDDFSGACNAVVVVLDDMGKVIDMNECFLNLVGMEKKSVQGKGFFETFIPGDIETLSQYFTNILKKDVYHQQFVTPMKGVKDTPYRINWQVSKIVKQDKTYIIAVGSDISKFVEENNTLKRELTSIKVGFDYFPFAVAYMNAKGKFIKMNSRFMKMFRIAEKDKNIEFDQIALLKKYIGFTKLQENVQLMKEMSHTIDFKIDGNPIKLKVDIRLLSGKKESAKLYIVVVQKIT